MCGARTDYEFTGDQALAPLARGQFRGSILYKLIDVIDHEKFDRPFVFLQFQPELPDGGNHGGVVGRIVSSFELHSKIVLAGEASPIENGCLQQALQSFG